MEESLDFRYQRGPKPEVYYRCPTLESLEDALRNELEKLAQSLIPEEAVVEFVFSPESTITVPVAQQPNLGELGVLPAEYPQTITIDQALCRNIEGADRLKIQRAVTKCLIELVERIDGYRYRERQAWNKDGEDGIRFKFVCSESLQNRDRQMNRKRGGNQGGNPGGDVELEQTRQNKSILPTYDCGGALHIIFSTQRNALNVVYRHNSIHRDIATRPQNGQQPTTNTAYVTPHHA